ncbi:hypothetical protein R1sor_012413 [Riccia sorocarpa]|uniref:FCP1 homology domain-containing protein n=1 Tax=Riccia sorocarpa TaxID=122646 RepID=A0ABD3I7R6_9MARC
MAAEASRPCAEPRRAERFCAGPLRAQRLYAEPLAAADLPGTSQRPGKKRVHEGSAGSPPKRRKPVVQPPPKPAPSKAKPNVKAPKRVKRERTESVEAVVVEAVEKEMFSEGPWLIKRYYKVDVVSKVQWAYMKPEDICGAFARISEFHQRRLGLRGVITRQYVPPNVPLCKEWLLSFDGGPQHDCSATIQGQRIVLTEEMFRDAFFIPEELNPGASSHPFPKHVMRSALGGLVLAPRSISGPIIHFVKSALEPVIDEEDTSMIAHPKLLDLAGYQFKCVRDEMMQVKKHLEQPNNSRLRETFVGQVLTHLLIHLGIYKGRTNPRGPAQGLAKGCGPAQGLVQARGPALGPPPCTAPRRAAQDPHGPAPRALRGAASPAGEVLEPEMQQRLLHALQTDNQMDVRLKERKAELAELERAVRRKTLILAFDGLLVSIKSTAEEHSEASQNGWDVLQVRKGCFVVVRTGLVEFLQACIREFHLMIWTSRPRTVIDRIFRFLFKSKKISFDFAHDENCTVWSREQCFDLGKTSVPLYYKDFDMLYEHNINARDVLMVEDEMAKIGCNNLMNALVPKRWDLSFVEETRPWATLPWVEEPIEALMKWWGHGVKKTKTWTNILFRSCTYEERKSLRDMWTGITVRQKARVESVERQKSHVESVVPVESSTPVLSAARVAID